MKMTNSFFLIGPMGAGKTTIGKMLANLIGYQFLDSDHVLIDRSGMPIARIFERDGESGFRMKEREVLAELTCLNQIVLATGGGCVMSPENLPVIKNRGLVIYLNVTPQEQYQRVKYDSGRPLLQTDDPLTVLTQLYEIRHPLYHAIADYTVLAENISPACIAQVLAQLVLDQNQKINNKYAWLIKH